MRELLSEIEEGKMQKTILQTVIVKQPKSDLLTLSRTESRIFLLYSTKEEAIEILQEAKKLGLMNKNYVWIVSQSVIGTTNDAPEQFTVGMLGVHFKTDSLTMIEQIGPAISAIGKALDLISESTEFTNEEKKDIVQSNISCTGDVRWSKGEIFFNQLKNVSVPQKDGSPLEFNNDGSLKFAEIKIVNLQLDSEASKTVPMGVKKWEEIGIWQSNVEPQSHLDDQFQHGKMRKLERNMKQI